MTITKKITWAAACAGLALTMAFPAVANADTASPAAERVECLDIGLTHRTGNDIIGYGSIRRACQGKATITVQWSRWFGWENLRSATVQGPGYDQEVRWNCTGSGTHEFRTIIESRVAGDPQSKTSNTITATC
jgi:hypothetical protein